MPHAIRRLAFLFLALLVLLGIGLTAFLVGSAQQKPQVRATSTPSPQADARATAAAGTRTPTVSATPSTAVGASSVATATRPAGQSAPPAATATTTAGQSTSAPATATASAPTSAQAAAPTPTLGPRFITLTASAESIPVGSCATLTWTANVIDLSLNNESLGSDLWSSGTRQVCPTTTTEYVLSTSVQENPPPNAVVTISVTGAAPTATVPPPTATAPLPTATTAPPLPSFGLATVSATGVDLCNDGSVTVDIIVTNDPTVVSVVYGLDGQAAFGQSTMSLAAGDTWSVTLPAAQLPPQAGTLVLSFRAQNANGMAESGVVSSLTLAKDGC